MKLPNRSITALLMTVIYLLITLSPLAPLAMHSKRIAHAVTGHCSGDCDICGCSPERRASRTCCCWVNRLKRAHLHAETDRNPSCCRNKTSREPPQLTRCCPCDSNKLIGFAGWYQNLHLPSRFDASPSLPHERSHSYPLTGPLASRHGEPPDPPPKLFPLCRQHSTFSA